MNPNAITIASGIILIGWHQKGRHRSQGSDTRTDPERRQ